MSLELDFALEMAKTIDTLTMSRYRALDLHIETKPDRTPVTEADRAAELSLREMITARFPADGILGEEFDDLNPEAARQWILDPIDGTRNYLRGVPVWATLIALIENGNPVVGVVSAPALGRKWWAASGQGAFTQDIDGTVRPIKVSGISNLADASFSFSDPVGWEAFGANSLTALQNSVERVRAYGDFWSHMMVAEGVVDIAAEPELSPWDQAALIPVIREAGGKVTGLDGSDVMESGSSLTTNGLLHDAVVSVITNS
jgi:histidinol-phosphatase